MVSLKLAQHATRGGVFAVAAISCGSMPPGSKALPLDLSTVPLAAKPISALARA